MGISNQQLLHKKSRTLIWVFSKKEKGSRGRIRKGLCCWVDADFTSGFTTLKFDDSMGFGK